MIKSPASKPGLQSHQNASVSAHQQATLLRLIEDIVAGKQAALGVLYDLTADALNALVLRLVRNHADSDDVLSEVYKQVWERPRQYQLERGPVMAWLFVIARTRALDLLRKRRNNVDLASVAPSAREETDTPVQTADDLLQSIQESSHIHRALLQLTAEQRRMLDLAYFQDMSHQEIADATGMALGTVKSHIRRGQQALKEVLETQGLCL
jgi:RNA polymerase sigma-70 factor (ECF subfamily)